ncbi:16S rRNA (adenine(1518)-N(6)/adenine(1519)-N(6))-dimethyltransferase RsmA [Fuerstiella marisgermanici]|uniref:Ribosomal RNA small subunit methyltransferase A n=1 Tax=Fuerstiella marisgermanici TaxID=1891926 RepID=A0A1P8WKI1_9PLAN|nr:16S rRNA (adenine(1518)-N(6)/adenine(1519)-N(6))-dimethyltransferase RsmA [Fuerstiella marisgermanici]APZ94570.1 Ribosomal RNA small subunit methyltransferase A [Fuerstiella marisgermanici]
MQLFKQFGFNPRSDLGQNFLIDINLIEFAVRAADITKEDVVLEVGTGTGGMTTFLAEEAGKVISVEIDRNMFALATAATEHCDNVTLINQDILKNKNTIAPEITELLTKLMDEQPESDLKLVANLPYSVATPVISNLVASDLPWQKMVCTIQLELGEKMIAEPGSSNYGALSVWMQSQCNVKILRRLGPKVFWPRPGVDSAIISIWRHDRRGDRIIDKKFFLDFLRRMFHHRRKLMRSVLVRMYSKQLSKPEVDELIQQQELDLETRAEALDVLTLVKLGNRFCEAIRAKE